MTDRKTALQKKLRDNPFLVLEDEIFDYLYQDIIHLRTPPGTRLNEQSIAQEFGTSRTPVRKALSELVTLGLLTRESGRSTRVAHMTMAKSKQLYEARIVLEPHAAYLAADRIYRGAGQAADRADPAVPGPDLYHGRRIEV